MASKFGLAGGIPERRVRPIWDAVDSRQFKTALKLSVTLLAKYPNSPYALALKALILERMGKADEALSICLNSKELLYSNNIIDDLTLSTLQIVFQRLDRLDLATSCYEHACSKFSNNLEILMGLFNCYVREYSFVKQQQTAIKMYKIVPEERFLLWAVCSIQLQVFCSSSGQKLLLLAEALLKKHIVSHSLHEPEALVIYISILEQQAKYEAALEILSGKLGSLVGIEVDKLRMQGRLLARACDYAAAAETFQKVLEACPDDWESFLHYFCCLLEDEMNWTEVFDAKQISLPNFANSQTCKSAHLTDEAFDSRISSALSFVQKLQTEVHNDSIRGPYLASVEIERRCRLRATVEGGKFFEVLLNYFNRFSHLSCFTSDVEMFIPLLTDKEKADLLENVVRTFESLSATPIKALGQVVTIFKVQEMFGVMFTLIVEEVEGSAIRMVGEFCKNLTLSRDLDPQENMHGEELLSMTCNVLVQLFWRTRDFGYFLEAIMVLEFGLTIRRHVWQYKVLLLHLYSHLQALPLAYEWYTSLDIKNILLETFSHHIFPQMFRSPLLLETNELLKEYIKFMDDHLKEAADLTFLAYRHRNYSKVIEFVQFKERLQHSNQYLIARLEASVIELKQKADNLDEIEIILGSSNDGIKLVELSNEDKLRSLTFNEDLQTRPWWSPTSHVNYLSGSYEGVPICLQRKLYTTEPDDRAPIVRKTIERRSLLARLIYLSIQIASSAVKENVESNGSVTHTDSSRELKALLERYARNVNLSFDDAVEVIIGISKGEKSFKDYDSDMVYWINFAIFVNAWNLCSHDPRLFEGKEPNSSSWQMVDSIVESCITEQLISLQQPISTSTGSNLPVLVELVTESLSWHILVIQSCLRSMLPSSKKKKKSGTVDHPNILHLQPIGNSMQCSIDTIQSVQRWLSDQINRPEDESVDVLLSQLRRREEGVSGPGRALRILEEASSDISELGERISGAMQSWSSANAMRRIVGAQHAQLLELRGLCDSKLKLLESLKQSI